MSFPVDEWPKRRPVSLQKHLSRVWNANETGLRRALSIGAFALCSAALDAQASTVTVGSLTVDDTAFTDKAEPEQGTLVGRNNATSNMLGNTFGTSSHFFTNLRQNGVNPSEVAKVGFTNNTLGNDAGADVVIWEALMPQATLMSLSLGGHSLAGTFLETFTLSGSAKIHAYTYDLTDLGVADLLRHIHAHIAMVESLTCA